MHFSDELPLSALFNRLLTASDVTQWALNAEMKKFELGIEKKIVCTNLGTQRLDEPVLKKRIRSFCFDEKFQVKPTRRQHGMVELVNQYQYHQNIEPTKQNSSQDNLHQFLPGRVRETR